MKKQINQGTPPAGNDDFNELLYDKQKDEVIQPDTPAYREAFYELNGRYPGEQPPAGNDLPQQLEVGYDLDNNDVGIVDLSKDAPVIVGGIERRLAAEIVRRYNDFPALQEQNRELLQAVTALNNFLRWVGKGIVEAGILTPGGIKDMESIKSGAETLLSKYSK